MGRDLLRRLQSATYTTYMFFQCLEIVIPRQNQKRPIMSSHERIRAELREGCSTKNRLSFEIIVTLVQRR